MHRTDAPAVQKRDLDDGRDQNALLRSGERLAVHPDEHGIMDVEPLAISRRVLQNAANSCTTRHAIGTDDWQFGNACDSCF